VTATRAVGCALCRMVAVAGTDGGHCGDGGRWNKVGNPAQPSGFAELTLGGGVHVCDGGRWNGWWRWKG